MEIATRSRIRKIITSEIEAQRSVTAKRWKMERRLDAEAVRRVGDRVECAMRERCTAKEGKRKPRLGLATIASSARRWLIFGNDSCGAVSRERGPIRPNGNQVLATPCVGW